MPLAKVSDRTKQEREHSYYISLPYYLFSLSRALFPFSSQTLDERETLRILPESLQFDISFAVKERAIKSVPILKTLSTITQRRFAHALVLQVYPPHATIYNVGDIGWEIYFIVSGVVSVSLPADLSELDTTGKSNAAANKQKFESTGKMLSIGNHIGESCLSSKSGVRQETITAKTTVELYALSKDDLYNICRFMSLDKKKNLIESFLRRNGNVWHSFDDECPDLDADEVTDTSQSSSFPWSAQNNLTQLTIGPINKSKTMVRRRRLSLAQARIRSLSYTSRDGPGTMFSEHQIKHNDDADSVKDQDQSISSIVWDPGGAS